MKKPCLTLLSWLVICATLLPLPGAPATLPQNLKGDELEKLIPAEAGKLAHEWLRTGTPMQRAWAAYWVERDRQIQEIPQLLGMVAQYAKTVAKSPGWTDGEGALPAVLDALIQFHAEVPGADIESLYARFPVQAIILLSRSSDDVSDILMGIFDRPEGSVEWLAAADLLAANPPPGFAARLLKGITVHASVYVVNPGESPGFPGGIGCASTSAYGRGGWPPAGAYHLTSHQTLGSVLLVDGEDPVYMRRAPDPDHDQPDGCGDVLVDVTMVRRDLVGQLLGMKKDSFPLKLEPSVNIEWTTPESYADAAAEFVRHQQDIRESVESGLGAEGLLTADEIKAARPALEVSINDQRAEKTPLPDLQLNDPAITVTYHSSGVDPNEPADPQI